MVVSPVESGRRAALPEVIRLQPFTSPSTLEPLTRRARDDTWAHAPSLSYRAFMNCEASLSTVRPLVVYPDWQTLFRAETGVFHLTVHFRTLDWGGPNLVPVKHMLYH